MPSEQFIQCECGGCDVCQKLDDAVSNKTETEFSCYRKASASLLETGEKLCLFCLSVWVESNLSKSLASTHEKE
jgi:hypothetical protein